ncbi:MAG TPA: Uma2 family endonuclease [Solirubrobacteraceae bacterium]|jgi:Uma2 family endonuclease
MATTTRITADEFLARPEEERFAQLIGGEVVVTPPTLHHQGIVGELHWRLMTWAREKPGRGLVWSEVAVRVGDRDVFVPDVVWVAEDNRPAPGATVLTSPPDLAIEVRSPSTWRYDIGAMKDGYEHAGLRELWLVDHQSGSVIVFGRTRPGRAGFDVALEVSPPEPLRSPQLPGFSLDLTKLFA